MKGCKIFTFSNTYPHSSYSLWKTMCIIVQKNVFYLLITIFPEFNYTGKKKSRKPGGLRDDEFIRGKDYFTSISSLVTAWLPAKKRMKYTPEGSSLALNTSVWLPALMYSPLIKSATFMPALL